MASARFVFPENDDDCDLSGIVARARHAVQVLRNRNWNVPGFVVGFTTVNHADDPIRYVSRITANGISLWLTPYGVNTVRYGMRVLSLRGRQTSLRVYNGSTWEEDYEAFYDDTLEDAKVLRFKCGCRCTDTKDPVHSHPGRYGLILTCEGQADRSVEDEERLASRAIQRQIITPCESTPTSKRVDIFTPKPIPLTGVSFCALVHLSVAEKLHKEQRSGTTPTSIGTEFRYTIFKDGAYHELTTVHGATIGTFSSASSRTPIDTLPIARYGTDRTGEIIVRITPRDANGIYVIDRSAFDFLAHRVNRKTGDDEIKAALESAVPLTAYSARQFDDPVILGLRDFTADELEIVGGTWTELEYARTLIEMFPDSDHLLSALADAWTPNSQQRPSVLDAFVLETLAKQFNRRWAFRRLAKRTFPLWQPHERARHYVRHAVRALGASQRVGIYL